MRNEEQLDRAHEVPAGPRTSPWILRVLLGGVAELSVDGRRYRLTQEKAFRLEELDGNFVFFMGSAGTVERRLRALAGGSLGSVELTGPLASTGSPDN